MINDLDWKQPALIGGLIVGIASAIPGVSALNCCFCGWALIGGAIAAKIVIGSSSRPLRAGDGAMLGLYAGLIGGVVFVVVAVPIILSGFATDLSIRIMENLAGSVSNPELQEAMAQVIAQVSAQGPFERLISSIPVMVVQVILQAAFTVVGGLLGVSLFERRRSVPPPPPYYDQA